jgi:hypothetical protein
MTCLPEPAICLLATAITRLLQPTCHTRRDISHLYSRPCIGISENKLHKRQCYSLKQTPSIRPKGENAIPLIPLLASWRRLKDIHSNCEKTIRCAPDRTDCRIRAAREALRRWKNSRFVPRRRSLVVLVLIDLTGHNHHPNQEHGSNDPKCECGLPALTCTQSISHR